MKETFGKLWEKIKRFGKEVFAFISSPIFLKNFGGIIVMLAVLFFFMTTWLKCYTDHGDGMHLANFEGMNLLDVKSEAKKQGYDIVVDSTDVNKAPLTVIEQHPSPDALVKEGRTIYLRVQQIRKDKKAIPKPGGRDGGDYREFLRKAKFLVSTQRKVDSRVASNTILDILYKGESIMDKINEGFELPGNSVLTLVVSERGYGNVSLPNLICKTVEQAKFILESNNLTVNLEYDQTVVDKNNAYVWLQDPAKGSSIRYGDQVRLRVTQNLPDDCEENELEAPVEKPVEENQDVDNEAEQDTSGLY